MKDLQDAFSLPDRDSKGGGFQMGGVAAGSIDMQPWRVHG